MVLLAQQIHAILLLRIIEVWTSTGDYCMNGITRLKVIQLCKNNNIPIFEKNFSLVDVYSAQGHL